MQNALSIAYDHLVESLHNRELSQVNQVPFNLARIQTVIDALRVRPAFLPVQISLPAAVQQLPKTESTHELPYDVVIHGAITDGEEKKINFRRNSDDSIPFVSVGEASGSQLTLEAIAGKSLESGGKHGLGEFYPFLLRAYETLAVDIYKPVATAGIDVVTICFAGSRVFSKSIVEEMFNRELRELVESEIKKRVTPEPRYAVADVIFKADGTASAETRKVAEPRLIHGFRTTVKNAMVNLGFDPDTKFARDLFPIWALAAEAGNTTENYRPLKKPIFLAPYQQVYFTLKNTINSINYAADGQIELMQTTV